MIAPRQYAFKKTTWDYLLMMTELEEEKNDILIGCFDDEKLEGCCLLTDNEPDILRLRQMAVVSGLQGKGIGKV